MLRRQRGTSADALQGRVLVELGEAASLDDGLYLLTPIRRRYVERLQGGAPPGGEPGTVEEGLGTGRVVRAVQLPALLKQAACPGMEPDELDAVGRTRRELRVERREH